MSNTLNDEEDERSFFDSTLPSSCPSSSLLDEICQSYKVPDILDHLVLLPDTSQNLQSNSNRPLLSANATHSDSSLASQQQTGTVEKSREKLMSEIEETIMQMIHSIMVGQLIHLPLQSRRLSASQPQQKRRKSFNRLSSQTYGNEEEGEEGEEDSPEEDRKRILSLNSGNCAKALARYISVLQMIYEAISYKITVTKRDIFYRDVVLFGKQAVVDIIVDDISCHYNVPRSSLNVTAASKGLIFGPVKIILKNGKALDCMSFSSQEDTNSFSRFSDEQGTLIPPISQVAEIQSKAKCMIIIEKEATFRYLVSIGFCRSLQLQQDCILVTGKGYPDLSTRQLVKYFSTHFSTKPILALMDNDPHGLDIYATYKWGARAMAFDVLNLAVNNLELIGLRCQDREDFHIPTESWIPMTDRDRLKCTAMVRTCSLDETPGESQLVERGWRDTVDIQLTSQGHREYIHEIYKLLESDHKCELQALNAIGPYGLSNYLTKKLSKYLS